MKWKWTYNVSSAVGGYMFKKMIEEFELLMKEID